MLSRLRFELSPVWVTIFLLLLLMLTSFIAVEAAGAKMESAKPFFYQANSLYEEGKYKEAVQMYEKIIAAGDASGNVYYNLGNAYYRLGEKGQALLNYLRARTLIPRDPDLRSNLMYLLNELQLPEESQGFFAWLSSSLLNMASLNEYVFILEICLTLTAGFLLIWLVLPQFKKYIKIPLLVTVLCLILLLSATGVGMLGSNPYQAVVVKGETTARFEPAKSGGAFYTLKEGSSVIMDSSREGWVLIRRTDGKEGWVPEEDIRPLKIQRTVTGR